VEKEKCLSVRRKEDHQGKGSDISAYKRRKLLFHCPHKDGGLYILLKKEERAVEQTEIFSKR